MGSDFLTLFYPEVVRLKAFVVENKPIQQFGTFGKMM